MTPHSSSASSPMQNQAYDGLPFRSSSRLRPFHRDVPSPSSINPRIHDATVSSPQPGSRDSTATTLIKSATASAREHALDSYHRICGAAQCNENEQGECEHGLLSPHASSPPTEWADTLRKASGDYGGKLDSRGGDTMHAVLDDAMTEGLLGQGTRYGNDEVENVSKVSTTGWLAKRHGIQGKRRMYVLR